MPGPRQESLRWNRALWLALALSVGLHALLGIGSALFEYAIKKVLRSPIQVEILPPKKKPAPPPLLPPDKPSPPSASASAPEPAAAPRPVRPKTKPKVEPKAPATPAITPLRGLGPAAIDEDLGVRVLLRMETLRTSPHRASIERLLGAFPDAAILPNGTRLSQPGAFAKFLIDDFTALLIATAQPSDITASVFLAAHDPQRDPGAALKGRQPWPRDPRTLRELTAGLLAFARPELLGPSAAAAPVLGQSWMAQLREGIVAPGPAVSAEILNVRQRARFGEGLPTPTAVRVGLSGDARPLVHARIELGTPAEAAQLAAALPVLRERMNQRLFWVGLSGLLADLRFAVKGAAVEITGRLPESDTDLMLAQLAVLLPAPPRGVAPTPPPAPETAPENAGAPEPPAGSDSAGEPGREPPARPAPPP